MAFPGPLLRSVTRTDKDPKAIPSGCDDDDEDDDDDQDDTDDGGDDNHGKSKMNDTSLREMESEAKQHRQISCQRFFSP